VKKYTGKIYVINFVLEDEKNNIVTTNAIALNNKYFCGLDSSVTLNFLIDLNFVIPTAIAEKIHGTSPHKTVRI